MRDEVAQHYRLRGYTIREHVQVRGASGAVHPVDMVAQGPLGNLVIAFEDAGGFDGPEMNAVRRVARDVGATPVVAATRIPEGLRRIAADAGVVLLDIRHMEPVVEETTDDDVPAWPDPDRAGHKSTDPGIWRYPRDDETDRAVDETDALPLPAGDLDTPGQTTQDLRRRDEAVAVHGASGAAEPSLAAPSRSGTGNGQAFSWLPKQDAPRPGHVVHAPLRRPTEAPPATTVASGTPWARWLIAAVAAGASAGGAFYLLQTLLG